MERDLRAGKHPPRQRHRWDEAAPPGVTILRDLRLAMNIKKIDPVPQRWQAIRGRDLLIERGGERTGRKHRDVVVDDLATAYPGFELVDIHADRAARKQAGYFSSPLILTPLPLSSSMMSFR